MGWYGRGIYFSRDPSYCMYYIKDNSQMLLSQVIAGKVYRCQKYHDSTIPLKRTMYGKPLVKGFDSHCDPSGKELVIFDSAQILPSYIVHFKKIAKLPKNVPKTAVKKKVSKDFDTKIASKTKPKMDSNDVVSVIPSIRMKITQAVTKCLSFISTPIAATTVTKIDNGWITINQGTSVCYYNTFTHKLQWNKPMSFDTKNETTAEGTPEATSEKKNLITLKKKVKLSKKAYQKQKAKKITKKISTPHHIAKSKNKIVKKSKRLKKPTQKLTF